MFFFAKSCGFPVDWNIDEKNQAGCFGKREFQNEGKSIVTALLDVPQCGDDRSRCFSENTFEVKYYFMVPKKHKKILIY